MKLKDKVIIISGGAGLLGAEFSKAIKDSGAKIIVLDNCSEQDWKLRNFDCDYFLSVDITKSDKIKNSIEKIKDRFGKIDSLVNAAYPKNKNYGKHFFDVKIDDFNQNVSMHLGSYFLMCQLFSDFLKENGGGEIVNIASIYGTIVPKFNIYDGTKMTMPIEYAVVKSGIISLTKYLAKYLKGSNIRVNSISPGGVFDGQPEKFVENYNNECLNKGMLSKSDLNGVIVFLLSDDSSYINGQNIIVDDGFSL